MGCLSSIDGDLFLRPLHKGLLLGIITISVYLLIVVITTPALDPASAVSAAVQLNLPIMMGMGVGVGLQSFLSGYAKQFGCNLSMKKRTMGGNSSSTAVTSFFSFFSLIPLGCCGWWLYAISFLPSIFGVGVSAALINYSQPLSYAGLAVIYAFNFVTYLKIKSRKKELNIT